MQSGRKHFPNGFVRKPRSERGVYWAQETQQVSDVGITLEDQVGATDSTESFRLRSFAPNEKAKAPFSPCAFQDRTIPPPGPTQSKTRVRQAAFQCLP